MTSTHLMSTSADTARPRRVGAAIIGFGGAVATTATAGIELLRLGLLGTEGLPLARLAPALSRQLVPYDQIMFAGWDINHADLATAAAHHAVMPAAQLADASDMLTRLRPWPAIGDASFCRNIDGDNQINAACHLDSIAALRRNLTDFRRGKELDAVVVINLASTEAEADLEAPIFQTVERFERAVAENDPRIGPAMLYAYAAILEGAPYANFTPSCAVDFPALQRLAEAHHVPLAGKDGKTGQTLLKTVIAPGLRARGLKIAGWYSTNILGNRDGLALKDPGSLASKLGTKSSVLADIMGVPVENHVVRTDYYAPRGDAKEAWDNIDIVGFLGQPMQIKVNFLCRDSVLAAPLIIELVRLLDLASRRGEGGIQEQLSTFFKSPTTRGGAPEHALHLQEAMLQRWLEADR